MRISRYVPLFLVFVGAIGLAATPAPTGFRSLTWGVHVPADLKKLVGPTSDGTSMYAPKLALQPFLGVPVVEEAYSFTRGKFYSGSVWLDGRANFDRMKSALISKYGQPTFANPAKELYKWKWAGQIDVYLYYQVRFSRTTVTFSNDAI